MWAEAAKKQSMLLRGSLTGQVASKLDTKMVDPSRLDWSVAEEGESLDTPMIGESIPRLNAASSVLDACKGLQPTFLTWQDDAQICRPFFSWHISIVHSLFAPCLT